MGIFDGIKAELRNRAAQRNLEKMAYREEFNKNRIELQKKKAKLDASKSLGLNAKGTKYLPKKKPNYSNQASSFGSVLFDEPKPQKKEKAYPNIKTESGFTYGGFK